MPSMPSSTRAGSCPSPPTGGAKDPARALGLAFQLTNYLRDISEDFDRGRVYLSQQICGGSVLILKRGAPRPSSGT
jgi:hypothetical protein